MSVTHEQDVVRAREQIAILKESYMASIKEFIKNDNGLSKYDLFLNLQNKGNAYFNYVENFVGNSDLLGAHENGLWVIGFAEDCAAVLESLILHMKLLRDFSKSEASEIISSIEPSKTAYSNMQRIVCFYLSKERSGEIFEKFKLSRLPTYGFDNQRLPVMNKTVQTIISFAFGVVFVVVLLVIAFLIPSPSDFQYTVFRIVLALAAGGVVAAFPGFVEISFGKWLRAGGRWQYLP